ncbi:MAG TPA: tetratricopeptide repeat protein [Verrucomicrobiae bacterium]
MNSENPDALKIFGEALALDAPAERAAYLEDACAGNPDLRQEVESLLAAYARAGDFLGQPRRLSEPDFSIERTGTRIGRYKLLEKIGEGGFGVVYLAEQEEPVQRKVALKIIKPGMDSREIVARFEAERQALALMDHPTIAKVLDGGVTEAGRPYFVMELVHGTAITRYCDDKALSTAERLQIFIQVCHAVQHAHQKGIIHRDLKPNNILVTLYDGKPAPKIIDFGVAKALGQKLTEKTLVTAFQQMIGTPAYMSPEQAEISGLDIDTRSDIYSLGVLLYELLTGVTPFDAGVLARAGLDEVRRLIREQEPLKPSTRLETLGNHLAEVARDRQTEPAALGRLVRGDLDWIVMKCLEKDRRRRYDTAQNVALDIEHYLSYEPVSAAAPSRGYLARKFIRRHKTGLAMVSALALMLIGAAVVSTRQAVRANRAETQAETVARMLTDILMSVRSDLAEGRDTGFMLDVLGKAGARVDVDLKMEPLIAARIQDLLGVTYWQLGNYTDAESRLRWALETRERLLGKQHRDTLTSLNHLARVLISKGDYAGAERLYRGAAFESALGATDLTTIASVIGLGYAVSGKGDYAEAESLFRKALRAQRLIGKDDHVTLQTVFDLAHVLCARAEYDQAELLLRGPLKAHEPKGPNDPDTLRIIENLARVLSAKGDDAGAESLYRRSLETLERTLPKDHPDTLNTLSSPANLLMRKRDYAGAESLYGRAAQGYKRAFRENLRLACVLHALGNSLSAQEKLAEAEQAQRESLAMHRKLGGPEHAHVPEAGRSLAAVLKKRGKSEEAELVNREVKATEVLINAQKLYGPENVITATALANVGAAIEARGEVLEAVWVYRQAYRVRKKLLGPYDPVLTESRSNLIQALAKTGKTEEAEDLRREAEQPRKAGRQERK